MHDRDGAPWMLDAKHASGGEVSASISVARVRVNLVEETDPDEDDH
jgi:hypothetical protein